MPAELLYSAEMLEAICERLVTGEPLASICRDPQMPCARTVRRWRKEYPEANEALQEAQDVGEEAIAIDCLVIADDASGDFRLGPKNEVVPTDAVARAKLRVDTRLKLLAKFNPRRWGERQALEHSGPNGGPIQTQAQPIPLLTREQWIEKYVDSAARPTTGSD